MNYEQEIKNLEAQKKTAEAQIEEAEAQIKVLKAVVEANQEAKQEVPPVWKPEDGETYYTPRSCGIGRDPWWGDGNQVDKYYLKIGKVFKTEQEAEDYDRALKLIETIRRERYKAQGKWFPDEREVRYTVCWDRLSNRIEAAPCWKLYSVLGLWRDLDVLHGVIKKHESELRWYFTEYLPSVNQKDRTQMNYEEEIKRLEAQLEEAAEQLKELKAEQELPPVWKPDLGEEYYVVDADYVALPYPWRDDRTDIYLLKRGAVFKSEEEAGNYDRAQKLIETIRRERFKAQGNWWPNELTSYTICWNRLSNRVDIYTTNWAFSTEVFGLWKDFGELHDVIKKHHPELRWYFTEYLPSIN